ncbi:MAG: transcription antiterminator [Clostridium sp.]
MNKRLTLIAELLLRQTDYITVNTIAKELNVSNKTIRNDLIILDEWLREYHLDLDKKTGSGVTILGDENIKLKILATISNKSNTLDAYSPEDRKNFILNKLFITDSKIRIRDISAELHVSRATIHKDLISIDSFLKNYKIQLVRKTNHGIEITAKEKDIRNAIFNLICLNKDYTVLKELLYSSKDNFNSIPSLKIFKEVLNVDFITLQETIMSNKQIQALNFCDESIISLLIHIAICIRRVSLNRIIVLSTNLSTELLNDKDYELAKTICLALTDKFNITFPEEEICYILLHIRGLKSSMCKSYDDIQNTDSESSETLLIANKIINVWSEILNLPLTTDEKLLSSLILHLKPVIHRFRFGFTISNPILDDIKNTYPYTYKCAKEACSIFEDTIGVPINDDEIGYLALHLISAIDRCKLPLKTLLICHGSVGASQLLTDKLTQEFNQIKIVSSKSLSSVCFTDLKEIDLVITTVPIDFDCNCNVININSLLKKEDIIRLTSIIKTIYSDKNSILAYN